MEIVLLVSLALLPFVAPPDPAPGASRTRTESRNFECERLSAGEGASRHPGQIQVSRGREDYVDRSAVVCASRLAPPGLRPPRDEAILSTLDARASDIVAAATSLHPDLADRTWLVDAFYPSAQVSSKIAFATKNALMGQGLRVSDRTPVLSAGDVGVLTRMHPDEAYSTACSRYAASGGLGDDDVLLAVVSRDRRATILHAGLCARGRWAWLE